jgi:hypothetical protein
MDTGGAVADPAPTMRPVLVTPIEAPTREATIGPIPAEGLRA